MLLIISNNDKLLENAAKLLSSNSLISNLNKSTIIIDEKTNIKDLEDKENKNKIYLQELGYENILMKGPFSQEVIMDVNVPKEKVVTNSSKLKFNITYAENLDFERSLATVYVNDVPIGSKKLSKDKSNNDTLEFDFLSEVVGKNYYQIKVVVPSKLTSKELTNVANIISCIGREVSSNNGNLNVVQDYEFKSNDKNSNLLVIGTPINNSIIKDLNSSLNLKFKDDFSGYEPDNKIKFVGDFSSQIESIQLIKSPYSNEKSAMVISETNSKDLNLATTYLTNLELTKSFKGDTVVVGENDYSEDKNYYPSKESVEVISNWYK